jgi:hypothetical protein
MRAATLLILALVSGGCVADFVHRDAHVVATTIGLSEDEVVAIAKSTSERYKRPIAWIKMSAAPAGTFEVVLHDHQESPYGIIIVFRKIDGRWQEDPELKGNWIV